MKKTYIANFKKVNKSLFVINIMKYFYVRLSLFFLFILQLTSCNNEEPFLIESLLNEQSSLNDDLSIIEEAPAEFEGIKLAITYQDIHRIEIREPFNNKIFGFMTKSPNSKISQNIKHVTSNVVIYGDSNVEFFDTGLERHGGHFHTWDPFLHSSNSVLEPTVPFWRNTLCTVLSKKTGSLFHVSTEGVEDAEGESDIIREIVKVSEPHNGICVSLGFSHFAVTDIKKNSSPSNPTIIKLINRKNEVLTTVEGFKNISSATVAKDKRDEIAVFSTDKGIQTFRLLSKYVDKKYQYTVNQDVISLPEDFNNRPFDLLLSRTDPNSELLTEEELAVESVKLNSVLAVKKDKGIYEVDAVTKQIRQLISINNIKEFVLNHRNTHAYVLTTSNELIVFDMNTYSELARTKIQANNKGLSPRISSSKRMLYIAYPGTKTIMRFDALKLTQYKPILTANLIADITIAGNFDEFEVNNH